MVSLESFKKRNTMYCLCLFVQKVKYLCLEMYNSSLCMKLEKLKLRYKIMLHLITFDST